MELLQKVSFPNVSLVLFDPAELSLSCDWQISQRLTCCSRLSANSSSKLLSEAQQHKILLFKHREQIWNSNQFILLNTTIKLPIAFNYSAYFLKYKNHKCFITKKSQFKGTVSRKITRVKVVSIDRSSFKLLPEKISQMFIQPPSCFYIKLRTVI